MPRAWDVDPLDDDAMPPDDPLEDEVRSAPPSGDPEGQQPTTHPTMHTAAGHEARPMGGP